MAWTSRYGETVLLMATNNGLFEQLLEGDAPIQIDVDSARANLGFSSVVAAVGARGTSYVAVAARTTSGVSVYLSTEGGPSRSFKPLSLKDENVKTLEIQQDGPNTFLWAALALIAGSISGKGAVRWKLQRLCRSAYLDDKGLGWRQLSRFGVYHRVCLRGHER